MVVKGRVTLATAVLVLCNHGLIGPDILLISLTGFLILVITVGVIERTIEVALPTLGTFRKRLEVALLIGIDIALPRDDLIGLIIEGPKLKLGIFPIALIRLAIDELKLLAEKLGALIPPQMLPLPMLSPGILRPPRVLPNGTFAVTLLTLDETAFVTDLIGRLIEESPLLSQLT